MPELGHIAGGADGWLNVKAGSGGQIVALPRYLKIQIDQPRSGRDSFTTTEGSCRGHAFSVTGGYLKIGNPGWRSSANLEFSVSSQMLSFPGGQVRAITDAGNPVATGTHPVQIPDFPHEGGAGYLGRTRYAKTWFYLGRGAALPGRNDRYLHTGRVSAGCVTVDPSGWTALYEYLILCRSSDAASVGSLVVRR